MEHINKFSAEREREATDFRSRIVQLEVAASKVAGNTQRAIQDAMDAVTDQIDRRVRQAHSETRAEVSQLARQVIGIEERTTAFEAELKAISKRADDSIVAKFRPIANDVQRLKVGLMQVDGALTKGFKSLRREIDMTRKSSAAAYTSHGERDDHASSSTTCAKIDTSRPATASPSTRPRDLDVKEVEREPLPSTTAPRVIIHDALPPPPPRVKAELRLVRNVSSSKATTKPVIGIIAPSAHSTTNASGASASISQFSASIAPIGAQPTSPMMPQILFPPHLLDAISGRHPGKFSGHREDWPSEGGSGFRTSRR